MSHRALIAERQRNDRFNIYYSQNGADEIQLLDELRESVNVHGRVDWESLNGTTAPPMVQQFAESADSEYTVKTADTGNVVEPRPAAVDVPEDELLMASDLLEFEVLYVVDDGSVEAYWLAWTYPDVIRPWSNHIEVDAYRSGRVPNDTEGLMEFIDEAEPLRTISEFNRGWLSDETVRKIARDYHKWIYEMRSISRREVNRNSEKPFSQLLQTPEYALVFQVDSEERLIPPSHTFTVPIRIESPANASSMKIRESVADTRFNIGAGLNAAESVTAERLRQACADSLFGVVDEHLDQVASEFLPEQLRRRVEEHRDTREWQDPEGVWDS